MTPPEWDRLPPVERALDGAVPLVVDHALTRASLASHARPAGMLGELSHTVSPEGPAGIVWGLATLRAGVPAADPPAEVAHAWPEPEPRREMVIRFAEPRRVLAVPEAEGAGRPLTVAPVPDVVFRAVAPTPEVTVPPVVPAAVVPAPVVPAPVVPAAVVPVAPEAPISLTSGTSDRPHVRKVPAETETGRFKGRLGTPLPGGAEVRQRARPPRSASPAQADDGAAEEPEPANEDRGPDEMEVATGAAQPVASPAPVRDVDAVSGPKLVPPPEAHISTTGPMPSEEVGGPLVPAPSPQEASLLGNRESVLPTGADPVVPGRGIQGDDVKERRGPVEGIAAASRVAMTEAEGTPLLGKSVPPVGEDTVYPGAKVIAREPSTDASQPEPAVPVNERETVPTSSDDERAPVQPFSGSLLGERESVPALSDDDPARVPPVEEGSGSREVVESHVPAQPEAVALLGERESVPALSDERAPVQPVDVGSSSCKVVEPHVPAQPEAVALLRARETVPALSDDPAPLQPVDEGSGSRDVFKPRVPQQVEDVALLGERESVPALRDDKPATVQPVDAGTRDVGVREPGVAAQPDGRERGRAALTSPGPDDARVDAHATRTSKGDDTRPVRSRGPVRPSDEDRKGAVAVDPELPVQSVPRSERSESRGQDVSLLAERSPIPPAGENTQDTVTANGEAPDPSVSPLALPTPASEPITEGAPLLGERGSVSSAGDDAQDMAIVTVDSGEVPDLRISQTSALEAAREGVPLLGQRDSVPSAGEDTHDTVIVTVHGKDPDVRVSPSASQTGASEPAREGAPLLGPRDPVPSVVEDAVIIPVDGEAPDLRVSPSTSQTSAFGAAREGVSLLAKRDPGSSAGEHAHDSTVHGEAPDLRVSPSASQTGASEPAREGAPLLGPRHPVPSVVEDTVIITVEGEAPDLRVSPSTSQTSALQAARDGVPLLAERDPGPSAGEHAHDSTVHGEAPDLRVSPSASQTAASEPAREDSPLLGEWSHAPAAHQEAHGVSVDGRSPEVRRESAARRLERNAPGPHESRDEDLPPPPARLLGERASVPLIGTENPVAVERESSRPAPDALADRATPPPQRDEAHIAASGSTRRERESVAAVTRTDLARRPVLPGTLPIVDGNGATSPATAMPPSIEPRDVQVAPVTVRRVVEDATATDLRGVPVVRSARSARDAATLGARAFARDGVVHLPRSLGPLDLEPARSLLAHELVHTAQQRKSTGEVPPEDSRAGRALEHEARTIAAHVAETRVGTATPTLPPEIAHVDGAGALVFGPPATPPTATPAPRTPTPATATVVQRSPVEDDAKEPATPEALDLDELARRLYPRIRPYLRKELAIDRERAALSLATRR